MSISTWWMTVPSLSISERRERTLTMRVWKGQKTYIVKEGILTSYLHDRISAKHYGVAPTGNGRRDTFRNTPIPRMRATYMEAGNMKEADIISTVKKGIYCDQFTNRQVQNGFRRLYLLCEVGLLD